MLGRVSSDDESRATADDQEDHDHQRDDYRRPVRATTRARAVWAIGRRLRRTVSRLAERGARQIGSLTVSRLTGRAIGRLARLAVSGLGGLAISGLGGLTVSRLDGRTVSRLARLAVSRLA